jgi:hypothetical protein
MYPHEARVHTGVACPWTILSSNAAPHLGQ